MKSGHPMESKLSPEFHQDLQLQFVPAHNLYTLEFREIPTPDELAEFARYQSVYAHDEAKRLKGRSAAIQTRREWYFRMADRWKQLAGVTRCRVECMESAKVEGRTMQVFF